MSTLDVPASSGVAITLDKAGKLRAYIGNGKGIKQIATELELRRWRWANVDVSVASEELVIRVSHWERLAEVAPQETSFTTKLDSPVSLSGGTKPLTFAAGFFADGLVATTKTSSVFNGRLEAPCIQLSRDGGTSYTTWAKYNFGLDIPTDDITDVSGNAHHGSLINAPTRAVKAHDWDGSEPDWTKAKYGYGAIHFHDDDLDDAAWSTDFGIKLPTDIPSGAYAVVVKGLVGDKQEDICDDITFFVRPSPQATAASKPKTAMVLSTFTYLAYANERMFDESRASHMELAGGVKIRKDAHWRRIARREDLGCSLYDVHRDGSGNVFSSMKRPILNIRPDYVNWAFQRPREFSADLMMIGLLEEKLGRGGYDVVTDHDLHARGVDALKGYDVAITGCHPEYPSLESLNAYAAFARRGGSLMYLGGNGFYWVSATDPARPHRTEVRRGDQGCRSLSMPAGERMHSVNGGQGGLWRGRGRNPNTLFGIGSCACGSGPGVPYKFEDAVLKSPEYAWMFEGLEKGADGENLALLGVEGFGGGASGDEMDRLDYDLGSPSNTVLLARSTGHDDSFGVFNEEVMFPMVDTLGTTCPLVRSDLTIYETSGGGSVFSVGSINWYCSLGWNAYENNVARLTWNVLKRFTKK